MSNYQQERYLLMTLDPLHIGDGGSRLGRVDLSIVREPGTRLPKIPGTALHGAIRQYAAYCYGDLNTAGGGKKQNDSHPVSYTFGSIKETGGDGGQSGRVSISDGRLLLFPVYTLAGPVWVTCPDVLAEFGIIASVADDKVKGAVGKEHLNLGWLMLAKEEGAFDLPDHVPAAVKERAMLVSNKLFSQIVNSNLEVRTSVSIDPVTGAASDGALFTYEAVPRSAILWLDVVEDDFSGKFPADHDKAQELNHTRPLEIVIAGLKLAELLGIGGMGTRGFGRVRLLNGENGQ
jgi:CRISPR-associated protein Cmr4